MSISLVIVQIYNLVTPTGIRTGIRYDCVNRSEGRDVVRIGYHTHNKSVAGIISLVLEGNLQRVNVDGLVKFRGAGHVVSTGACEEIQETRSAETAGVDVRTRWGVGVDLAPAQRIGGFTSSVGVEVFLIRKRADRTAFRGEGSHIVIAVFATAIRTHSDIVNGAGLQVGELYHITSRVGNRSPHRIHGLLIIHLPGILHVTVHPINVCRSSGDIVHIEVGGNTSDNTVAIATEDDIVTGSTWICTWRNAGNAIRAGIVVHVIGWCTRRIGMYFPRVATTITSCSIHYDNCQIANTVIRERSREMECIPSLD